MTTRHVLGGLWLLSISLAAAAAGGAHEHGVAHLSLVQEGRTVTLGFESPLDSLVGFEHEPRTDEQKQALRQAKAALANAAQVVTFPAAARCVLQSADVSLPFDGEEHDEHKHDGQKHDAHEHEEHADADAEYVFDCEQPPALGTVTIGLFKTFKRLRRIDAEAATAAGQGKAVLRPAQAAWSLPVAR